MSKQEISKQMFDALQEEKKQLTERIDQIEVQLITLQGKYQAYQELLDAPTDLAKTIEAKEAKDESTK